MSLEKRTYTIETLTPVHVGSGEKKPRFLLAQDQGLFLVLDLNKLTEVIYKRAGDTGIHQFSSILMGESRLDGRALLSQMIKDPTQLKKILQDASEYTLKRGESLGKNIPAEIITHIRMPSGEPYIPGSTIKGAFRTALAYIMLKRLKDQDPNRFIVKIVKKIENDLKSLENTQTRSLDRIATRFASWLEGMLFRSTSLIHTESTDRDKSNLNNDILRVLRISDTKVLPKDVCTLEMVGVMQNKRFTGIDICVETIPVGSKLDFSMTIDWGLFERFKRSAGDKTFINIVEEFLKDPLKDVDEFSKDILEHENELIGLIISSDTKSIYSDLRAKSNILHLGYGGTFLTKTITLLLDEGLRAEILNLFKKRRKTGKGPVPSSRRFLKNEIPMGWVRLEWVN
ncbi:MAG: type III-A CRISPR-associated RAMP protein Csm5 [candidate division WOR-3 bacterium]